ncbi:MAG TPA: hypothetical protein PLP57_09960 [Candidatus Saccharicenans sp.]|jgi:ABC-type Fe3+-citrate transport system substrate-binding protein|nr:hypothetical protein [Candidatus Saccharicenans sp.]HRD02945.1 hypothetical protein [Candidatus Saccharicenans sp.]
MKGRRLKVISALVVFLLFILLNGLVYAQEVKKQEKPVIEPQTTPAQTPPQDVQKPRLDYMSTFLSRDTTPLGLKEDQEIRQILKQSRAKWMVRAGFRSILN